MVNAEFLGDLPIFSVIAPDRLQAWSSKFSRNHYGRGEIIFHQDDIGDRLHIIAKGTVMISIMSEGGHEQDIAVMRRGECFGEMALLDDSARSATAKALEETETLALLQEDFLQLLQENPKAAKGIITLIAGRLRLVNQAIIDLVGLDVPTRVARTLLSLARIYGDNSFATNACVIPLSQDDLAGLVGTSRETVSRSLNGDRYKGILSTSHRRIIINDIKGLEDIAFSF